METFSFFQYIRNFYTADPADCPGSKPFGSSSGSVSQRVFEFLEEPEEDQTVENAADIKKLSGNVEF